LQQILQDIEQGETYTTDNKEEDNLDLSLQIVDLNLQEAFSLIYRDLGED